MERIAKVISKIDRAISLIFGMIILLVVLYNGYVLWNTYAVYKAAALPGVILQYKPAESDPSNLSLNELLKINREVCAWLTMDDTNIDYPVVKGETNLSYINTDVYGKFSVSGSIFLDYRSSADFSDFYSLIYGHHMDGGAMFGDLERFAESDYFNSHSAGALRILGKTYSIKIFACVLADAYDRIPFTPNISENKDKDALLSYIENNAAQYRKIALTGNDQIIGLSTCSDATTNGRILVYGQLVLEN